MTENALRERRDQIMPRIAELIDHQKLWDTVAECEATVHKIKTTPPLQKYDLYKASQRLLDDSVPDRSSKPASTPPRCTEG